MTDIDWELLFRCASNECSAEERARFEAWLASDPSHRLVLDAAMTAAGRALDSLPSSRAVVRMAPLRHSSPRHRQWLVGAAAACLTMVMGTAVLRRAFQPPPPAASAAPLRVATTKRGERVTLHLSDGTVVILGAASTLRYPASFAANAARELFLEGDGYFEVTHDARRPFRVHAGHATAEDLGTRFEMRAYPTDSAVRVVVADGSVRLGATAMQGEAGTRLSRGQLGRLVKGRSVASVQLVNADAYLGWTAGRLRFDDAPLAEVIAQLERWYAAEFRIADSSLLSKHLTASFTTESLADVLTAMAPAIDARFERRGDTLIVRARHAP